jgi:succinate dehydrogenase / fumarate reductase iron-sulfur subunit
MGTVHFRIHRGSASQGGRYAEYDVDVDRYTTVLEGLLKIREDLDPGLAIRYSCRMGMCGSCGVRINGRPGLACLTRVSRLGEQVTVDPMRGIRVVKDLVSDMTPVFGKYSSVRPNLVAKDAEEQEHPTAIYRQRPDQVVRFLQFNYCIQCGLCTSACPIASSDEQFLGPAALAVAYRYTEDSRDDAKGRRLQIVDSPHGLWGCRVAGSCSYVCPKGVDPSLAIQKLKGMALQGSLGRSSSESTASESARS